MISIEASTRTCKVDTASAARIESDRFLNPHNVVCPRWTGRDLSGRQVNADSFMTKRAGCNSAEDRVLVENALRPQYSEYINLDVNEGIRGQLYENNMYYQGARRHTEVLKDATLESGHFGGAFSGADRQVSCKHNSYERGVSQMEKQVRANDKLDKGQGCKYRHREHKHDQHDHHDHHDHHHKRHSKSAHYMPPTGPHHNGQIVEGYTDKRMVVASNNIHLKTAAAISGFRSCKFTAASGF